MKICKHEWEYDHTIDKLLPFGEIESIAVFKCKICGDYELQDNNINRIK